MRLGKMMSGDKQVLDVYLEAEQIAHIGILEDPKEVLWKNWFKVFI